jgi:hypothetical protein
MRAEESGAWRRPGELDLGSPGASARAEYERRVARDDRRRKEVFGRLLAPVVRAVAGERRSTTAWGRGGRGEEVVGISLNRAIGGDGFVLHDRSIPGTRSNIDHIAVVPSGIWVIDTKRYSGLVEQRDLGGWFTSRPALFVNGRNRTPLIPAVVRQMARIGEIVGTAMPVHGVLCFTEAEWRPLGRPFAIDHVTVTSERRLARSLRRPGPLDPIDLRALATELAAAFPGYGAKSAVGYRRH